MATANAVLTRSAREQLTGKWETAILTYLVYMIFASVGGVVAFIIAGPLQLGSSIFSLNIIRDKNAELSQILDGFKQFAESLVAYLLMVLYVVLWSLLLIIPGIIAAISYSQTFYILADSEGMHGADALRKSREMMRGYKWKYFCLGWRFLGWFFLCILTFGIGFLWLVPYMQVSYANFYEDIK